MPAALRQGGIGRAKRDGEGQRGGRSAAACATSITPNTETCPEGKKRSRFVREAHFTIWPPAWPGKVVASRTRDRVGGHHKTVHALWRPPARPHLTAPVFPRPSRGRAGGQIVLRAFARNRVCASVGRRQGIPLRPPPLPPTRPPTGLRRFGMTGYFLSYDQPAAARQEHPAARGATCPSDEPAQVLAPPGPVVAELPVPDLEVIRYPLRPEKRGEVAILLYE
jgi:hypothetical protein